MHHYADEAIDTLYRSDWGRIVAALIRLVGDFELAEEVAQEAFTAGVHQCEPPECLNLLARGSYRRRGIKPST